MKVNELLVVNKNHKEVSLIGELISLSNILYTTIEFSNIQVNIVKCLNQISGNLHNPLKF